MLVIGAVSIGARGRLAAIFVAEGMKLEPDPPTGLEGIDDGVGGMKELVLDIDVDGGGGGMKEDLLDETVLIGPPVREAALPSPPCESFPSSPAYEYCSDPPPPFPAMPAPTSSAYRSA